MHLIIFNGYDMIMVMIYLLDLSYTSKNTHQRLDFRLYVGKHYPVSNLVIDESNALREKSTKQLLFPYVAVAVKFQI